MTERSDEIAAGSRRRTPPHRATPAATAGRDPDEVTLVVVTKFFPASDVRVLADLGVRHVGENRHQEAEAKAAECADLGLTWHYVGGLQSNKAAAVATYADVVESVDRAKLLSGLSRGAHQRSHDLDCLVQVSLDPPDAGGAAVRRTRRRAARPRRRPGLARDAPAARPDGRRAARRGPGRGVHPARRRTSRLPRRPPRRDAGSRPG